MSNLTLRVNVQSTHQQRFDSSWREALADVLASSGAAVTDVGGGTDLQTGESDNEYEVTARKETLDRMFEALRSAHYSYRAFDELYNTEVSANHA